MQNNVEIIQINISGEDKPGMTSSLTEILARYDAFILDIGQANIHQSLTLGILFKTTSDKSGNIMKELLFKASELGVMIRFTPISEQNYDNWVGRQGKNRYIITLLGRTVTARHIAEVTRVVAQHGLNIDAIKRLTGRIPLSEDDRAAKSCIELSVRGSLTDEERSTMQEGFMNLSEIGLDVSFQKDDIYRRSRRLICFDMDSTLIETEVIDELAERAGVPLEDVLEALEMRGAIAPVSLDTLPPEDDESAPLSAFLGQEDRGFADFEKNDMLRRALNKLDERQREVIRLRFFEGKGQREVAQDIGVSQMTVSRVERQALALLREALTEGENKA